MSIVGGGLSATKGYISRLPRIIYGASFACKAGTCSQGDSHFQGCPFPWMNSKAWLFSAATDGASMHQANNETVSPQEKTSRQIVGFIGLGNMGSNMATNLLQAGHSLVVYDKNDNAMRLLEERGARKAMSPAELARGVDVVVTMLPSSHHVMEVYLGKEGLLEHKNAIRPHLFIDSSTIDPATCRKLAAFAALCKLAPSTGSDAPASPAVVDAPVSGGVLGAKAATLTFMVGGSHEAVEQAKGVLGAMGTRVVHCGPSGSGAAAKLCNNLALAVQMAGTAEALALGQKLGLDSRTLSNIFNTSSARCWSSEVYNPVPGVMNDVPAARGYVGGFSNLLMAKDLKLALESAMEDGVEAKTPMGSAVHSLYSEMCMDDAAKADFSSIFHFVYGGVSADNERKDSFPTNSLPEGTSSR